MIIIPCVFRPIEKGEQIKNHTVYCHSLILLYLINVALLYSRSVIIVSGTCLGQVVFKHQIFYCPTSDLNLDFVTHSVQKCNQLQHLF